MKTRVRLIEVASAVVLMLALSAPGRARRVTAGAAAQAQSGGGQSGQSAGDGKKAPAKHKQSSNHGVISGEQGGARGLTPPASAAAAPPEKKSGLGAKHARKHGRASRAKAKVPSDAAGGQTPPSGRPD